jgi:hypothetical protein
MRPIVKFSKDINKDIKNWYDGVNRISYGFDFSKKCPKEVIKRIKGKDFKEVKSYLKLYVKKFYFNYPRWKKSSEKNFKEHEAEIIKKLEKIHGQKFPVRNFIVYFTTFNRGPYRLGKGYF